MIMISLALQSSFCVHGSVHNCIDVLTTNCIQHELVCEPEHIQLGQGVSGATLSSADSVPFLELSEELFDIFLSYGLAFVHMSPQHPHQLVPGRGQLAFAIRR